MKKTQKRLNYYRLLVSSALITGGLFQLALPVFAAGTEATTQIKNTATATYEDPSNPGVDINATSNEVTVTVANVAGITTVGAGITDSTPTTAALPGDTLAYKFIITNTSNFDTPITIPTPVLTGALDPLGASSVTYQVYDALGNAVGSPTTTAPTGNIPRDGRIEVVVSTTVNTLAIPGGDLTVRLGDTGTNDNSAATQNQGVAGTSNVETNAGSISIIPVNGEREASAVQTATVAEPVLQKAFAAVLKTSAMTDVNNTPGILNDNTITYGLSLRVDATAPAGATGYTVADLAPTAITINGSPTTRILVSDVVPANTILQGGANAPVAPTGWTVIYSSGATSTSTNVDAVTDWTDTAPVTPAELAAVKRVGFVKSGTQAKGTLVTGFSFKVTTTGISNTTGGNVYNIAQLLGTTDGVSPTDPNYKVYDESGDQNPSNFNDLGAPGNQTPTTGVANSTTDGSDPGNNAGTDGTPSATSGGEDNNVTLTPLAATGVLNGPFNQSAAVGPTNNNDDFTNKAADLTTVPNPPSSGIITGYDPGVVTFNNTVGNPDPTATLSNIEVRPYTDALTGGTTNVPTGTTVTISYTDPVTTVTQTATYTYDGTQFNLTSAPGTEIVIPSLIAGQVAQYTVAINMPTGVNINTGYSVPISAFVDTNNDNIPNDSITNRTIDTIWTGYLQLTKRVRIIGADGTSVIQPFTQDPSAVTGFNNDVQPGRFLEYEVQYQNITQLQGSGSGNVLLNANNVVIKEDGVGLLVAANNWAKDNDSNGVIDTSNVVGKAVDPTTGSVITYFSGSAATTSVSDQTGLTQATDVTRYIDTVGTVVPQQSGTFTFRRRIN